MRSVEAKINLWEKCYLIFFPLQTPLICSSNTTSNFKEIRSDIRHSKGKGGRSLDHPAGSEKYLLSSTTPNVGPGPIYAVQTTLLLQYLIFDKKKLGWDSTKI